ncbi:hypothetical protein ACQEXU_16630 [Vibrio sp. TRT 21S02]|uniref:hypothetical protein n=1 Tax=unclassified Vibrio TaxID=2614977 RepID=UPI00349FADF6
MSADKDLVNFSEEHELNYCLRTAEKRQTQANRDALIELGKKVKEKLDKRVLSPQEVIAAIKENSADFE